MEKILYFSPKPTNAVFYTNIPMLTFLFSGLDLPNVRARKNIGTHGFGLPHFTEEQICLWAEDTFLHQQYHSTF